MSLSSKHKAYLRGLAHDKEPVILLGHKGVTPAVIAEMRQALLAHELIKVRLAEGDEAAHAVAAAALEEGTRAQLVSITGRVAVFYKQHPDKPKIVLPRAKKKKGLS